MIYHNSYWLIIYQIDFGKFLSDWWFIRSIFCKFLLIDIFFDKKCWQNPINWYFIRSKMLENHWKGCLFYISLLGLRHTLGVVFLKFQHLQDFKASNTDLSFQFKSDDNLSDWSLANSFQIDIWSDRFFANYFWLIFFSIKNIWILTKRLAKR